MTEGRGLSRKNNLTFPSHPEVDSAEEEKDEMHDPSLLVARYVYNTPHYTDEAVCANTPRDV